MGLSYRTCAHATDASVPTEADLLMGDESPDMEEEGIGGLGSNGGRKTGVWISGAGPCRICYYCRWQYVDKTFLNLHNDRVLGMESGNFNIKFRFFEGYIGPHLN